MQGMKFLVLNQEGTPANHGTIVSKVTENTYLCQFNRTPSICRVISVEEIMNYVLFPNDEQMNQFIESLVEQQPPPEKPTEPASKKKASKKKRNAKSKR